MKNQIISTKQAPIVKRNPTDKALNSSPDIDPKHCPLLSNQAGLRQTKGAHHSVYGPNTGSNSGGRWITKKKKKIEHFICTDLYLLGQDGIFHSHRHIYFQVLMIWKLINELLVTVKAIVEKHVMSLNHTIKTGLHDKAIQANFF